MIMFILAKIKHKFVIQGKKLRKKVHISILHDFSSLQQWHINYYYCNFAIQNCSTINYKHYS